MAPDLPESREVLAPLAERFGIEAFFGDVQNVAQRFADCARETDATVVARVLLHYLFADYDWIGSKIRQLEDADA